MHGASAFWRGGESAHSAAGQDARGQYRGGDSISRPRGRQPVSLALDGLTVFPSSFEGKPSAEWENVSWNPRLPRIYENSSWNSPPLQRIYESIN